MLPATQNFIIVRLNVFRYCHRKSELKAETRITSLDQHVYLNDLIVTVGDDYTVSLTRSNVRT